MPTRCRMPGDSSAGLLVRGVAEADQLEVAHGQRDALLLRAAFGLRLVDAEQHVVERGHPRQQARRLEHDAAVAARARRSTAPSTVTPPASAASSPATIESTVDLPQPEWPIRQTNSPWLERRGRSPADDERPAPSGVG